MADLLAATDVFVFPSRYEGLGGALLEAMASQIPIVVSDLAVTRRSLAAIRGFFRGGRDATTLAEAMIAAHERADDSVPTGARDRFMELFTLEAVGFQMADLYREIAAGAS